MKAGPEYSKTQIGLFHHVCYGAGILLLAFAWWNRHDAIPALILLGVAVLLFPASLMFRSLTVRDEGDSLSIRYGPIPLLGTRIPYSKITSVGPDRTRIIDGWGIHYIPWRGTTYNLWGFSCAKLTLGKRIIRIGSDDVDNLVAFLRSRIKS